MSLASRPRSWSKPLSIIRLALPTRRARKGQEEHCDHKFRSHPTRAFEDPHAILLRRIRSAQPDANIKILVATGFHRPSTQQELINKYGQEIVDHEQIVMHVSTDDSAMVKIGTLPSGGECIVNRTAAEADLLLAEGFIEPHLFAGFSGGRKSVLPGISSYKTIMANHCSEFINSQNTRQAFFKTIPFTKTCCTQRRLLA